MNVKSRDQRVTTVKKQTHLKISGLFIIVSCKGSENKRSFYHNITDLVIIHWRR